MNKLLLTTKHAIEAALQGDKEALWIAKLLMERMPIPAGTSCPSDTSDAPRSDRQ